MQTAQAATEALAATFQHIVYYELLQEHLCATACDRMCSLHSVWQCFKQVQCLHAVIMHHRLTHGAGRLCSEWQKLWRTINKLGYWIQKAPKRRASLHLPTSNFSQHQRLSSVCQLIGYPAVHILGVNKWICSKH